MGKAKLTDRFALLADNPQGARLRAPEKKNNAADHHPQ